jgi:hypothetical protein
MASAVDQVWMRFAEMFGAAALRNKFGDTPPDTWKAQINRLGDYDLQRGMRRALHFVKGVPSLPEFLRMCRESGGEYEAGEQPAPPSHQIEQVPLPRWELQANQHLIAHLMRRALAKKPVSEQNMKHYHTARLAWASDMRDAEAAGEIPADHGKAWFNEYIANADRAAA